MDYVQLPPLPSDMSMELLELIWTYAKLPKQERGILSNFMNENLKEDAKDFEGEELDEVLHGPGEGVNPDVEEFTNLMRNMLGGLIIQACQTAVVVYQEHCVEGKSVKEITENFAGSEQFVQLIAEYYDKRG